MKIIRILLGVLLVTLLLVPKAGTESKVSVTYLKNGLKVILKENRSAPAAIFSVWYRVGSMYEERGQTGLSHLLEHMMFKGSTSYKKGEFDKTLTRVGATNNAFTSQDETAYFEIVPSDQLELAIKVEADRMQGALMREEDLRDEMPVVRNELEIGEDSGWERLWNETIAASFTAHPYQWPIIGWRTDVEDVNIEELRAYYRRYYQPNNAFILAVGDFDTAEALKLIERHFGSLPSAEVKHPRTTPEPPQRGERRVNVSMSGDSKRILIAYHVPVPSSPDQYPLSVAAEILGGGKSSRLYKALVDGGIATEADASNEFVHRDPYLFVISAQLTSEGDPDKAVNIIDGEIARLGKEGISVEELNKVIKRNRVQFVKQNDSIVAQAFLMGDYEMAVGYEYFETYLDKLKEVKTEDVIRVVNQYLVRDNRTVGIFIPTGPAAGGKMGGMMNRFSALNAPAEREYYEDVSLPLWAAGSIDLAGSDLAGSPAELLDVTLPNGARIIVRENHFTPTVYLAGAYLGGSAYDPKGKTGLSNFAAEMLDKGTETYAKEALLDLLESNGIDLNYRVDEEWVGFSLYTLSEDFYTGLQMLQETLFKPTFLNEEIPKLKEQVRSSLRDVANSTYDNAYYSAMSTIYGPQSFHSRPVEGTLTSVDSFTREELTSFHKENLNPETMIIVVMGDVNGAELEEKLTGIFGGLKVTGRSASDLRKGEETAPLKKVTRKRIELEEKSNVSIILAKPGVSRLDPDYWTYYLANYILGGGFSTRLNAELRDNQGLTYGTFSTIHQNIASGPWFAYIGVNPTNVEKGADGLLEELRKYYQSGPTDDELRDARSYLIGSTRVRLRSNATIANALLDALKFGEGTDFIERYPDIIRGVTDAQVREAVKKYFLPDGYVLVEAGTFSEPPTLKE